MYPLINFFRFKKGTEPQLKPNVVQTTNSGEAVTSLIVHPNLRQVSNGNVAAPPAGKRLILHGVSMSVSNDAAGTCTNMYLLITPFKGASAQYSCVRLNGSAAQNTSVYVPFEVMLEEGTGITCGTNGAPTQYGFNIFYSEVPA